MALCTIHLCTQVMVSEKSVYDDGRAIHRQWQCREAKRCELNDLLD